MTEVHTTRIPKIKNGGLAQHGTEPLEQQQFRPAGVEGVKQNFKDIFLVEKKKWMRMSRKNSQKT